VHRSGPQRWCLTELVELPSGSLVLGAPTPRRLLFLPGFAIRPAAYRRFLAPVADAFGQVVVPSVSSLLTATVGRSSPEQEAAHVVAISQALVAEGVEPWLGGHSRGGLVAWLATAIAAAEPAGLVLVDPVGGGGPPWARPVPLPPTAFAGPALVLGCALGGRCAPEGRNHDVFAAALPHCRHTVVADCGHADMLEGPMGRLGRLACTHGPDPEVATTALRNEVLAFLP
jgi:pimeloyl-ACP methyl ester carboxylesterase